jgi:hypothetical protein
MKRLIGIAMALGLAGCDTIGNTVGDIKYDFDAGSFSDKTKAIADACAARMQTATLDPIRAKVELFKSPPDGTVPFTILTDKTAPSSDEQKLIAVWAQEIDQCQAKARKLLDDMPVPPQATQSEVEKLNSYITDAWAQGSQLRVNLYSGQTTYADYATDRLKIVEDALKTAQRYAQDTDEENETHDLEAVETALEPFASMM